MGAAILALMLAAAAAPAEPPHVTVLGTGTVRTAPDRATLTFDVTGEGRTSDAAVAALEAKRKGVADGLGEFLDGHLAVETGRLSIDAVRGDGCGRPNDDSDDDDRRPRLSVGPCAIVGYLARLAVTVKTDAVAKAGTALGLAGRLGGVGARLEDFALADRAAAQAQAVAAAMADARRQAQAIAAADGATLGPVESVVAPDAEENDVIVVTGKRAVASPVVASPPIVLAITPAPIETSARLTVTFALGR